MSLATLPLLRLVRSTQARLWLASATVLALGSALAERSRGASHGADHAVLGVYAAIAVPLLVFGLVNVTVEGRGLAASGNALIRLGASPRRVAFATVIVAGVASATACGVLGAVVAGCAHGVGDPPALRDAIYTLGLGGLGGAAYAAYFGLGAAIGLRGWGRAALLVLDWTVGTGSDVGAALLPRAHLRNLLGGSAPCDLIPRESLVALVVLTLLWTVGAARMAAWWRRSPTERALREASS